MVSSSLDKSLQKSLAKDTSDDSVSTTNTNNDFANSSGVNFNGDPLPTKEKIQLLFPKCKPRNDYQYQSSTSTLQDTSKTTNFKSITSSLSQSTHLFDMQANNIASNSNMNKSKLIQLQSSLSPEHEKQGKNLKTGSNHEQNDNFVETNPFRIESNNRYFYTPNDTLFNNNNSAVAASNNNGMMHHHYHYPSMIHRNYLQMASDDRNYYLESDEIEHNPYLIDSIVTSNVNNIPSSILKTSPPATPPALTTTPVDSPQIGCNRNMWDLSPIKTTTPTKMKTQSPAPYLRSRRGSYKKLLTSPVPIEEDLETGHFYYNNKRQYYQAPQTDSDSNEPAPFVDDHENEKLKPKALCNKPKNKHPEYSDYIYAEVKKKDERKAVKPMTGSGIIGW